MTKPYARVYEAKTMKRRKRGGVTQGVGRWANQASHAVILFGKSLAPSATS
jgi:hypothetical protein